MKVSILKISDNSVVIEFDDVIDTGKGLFSDSAFIDCHGGERYIVRLSNDEYMKLED